MFNAEKMYTFIRGYAVGANMKETLNALVFAREQHSGQFRKSGEPYIVHPLVIACLALSLGICDDRTIAAALLHDVVEDCDAGLSDLPVSGDVKHTVDLLTFTVREGETREEAKVRYYDNILTDPAASLIKVIDRCHNVSTMAGTFTVEKIEAYIEETRRYVIPLVRKGKQKYPEYSNYWFILRFIITAVVDSIDEAIHAYKSGPVTG